MINVKLPKIERATRRKIALITLFVIGVLTAIAFLVSKVALWFDNNKLIIKSPIVITTQKMVSVTPRVTQVVSPIVVIDYPEEVDTDIEKYICQKFGLMDCKMALAIAKAESGLKCDAIGINADSADIGVFQLNTAHLKRGGNWTLANMGDCYRNVDLAYELWKEQGFSPWVAFNTGAYLAKY